MRRLIGRPTALVLGVLLVGVAGCSAARPAGGPPPPAVGATSTEAVNPANLQKFFGNGLTMRDRGSFGMDLSQLVVTPDAPGGTMLRVSYPAGSASKKADGEDGGMQAYLRLPDATDTMYLQYYVRFQPDFDFVKGGKLPGFYGGSVTSGGNIPDGTDGFSTRYMWRSGGDGEVYAYLPTSQEHGTSLGRGCWFFTPGRWTAVEQRVQLNNPGASDGQVTVWQDGREVLTQKGLQFRTTPDLRIDGLFFSTFFGGGDSSWASPSDQYADFAGFTVSSTFIPPPADAVADPAPTDLQPGECGPGDSAATPS